MGIFQPELGVPGGHSEWLIGDADQIELAKFHRGQQVEIDSYLFDILDSITDPSSNTIFRVEADRTGTEYLALYTKEEDSRYGTWGGGDALSLLGHEIGV